MLWLTKKYLDTICKHWLLQQQENSLTNGSEVLEDLLAAASSYVEKQRKNCYNISKGGEEKVTLESWTGAIHVIVSFLSGVAVLEAALAYDNLLASHQGEPALLLKDLDCIKMRLGISGVESVSLRNWIEGTLTGLGINPLTG